MILRRVIDHVRKQEWTAIFLDFVIVVVGVFVGIQVSNWNADRLRAARSDAYRERFVDNLQSDINLTMVRQRYFSEAFAYGEAAMRVMDGAPLADDDARWRFVLGAYQAGQIWPFAPSGQIYRELQSAGELDLVGGIEVLDALANYYDQTGSEIGVTFGAIDPYRALVRQRTPWPIQAYIWENCHPNEAVDWDGQPPPAAFKYMLDCPAPADADLVRAAATAFQGDGELADALRGRLAELRVTLNFVENMRGDAAEALAALRDERGASRR